MNVGFCTISAKERPVEELLDMAGRIGFDGVEIWGQDHVGDGSAETCQAITEAADDAGVDIPAYGSYLRAADERDLEADPDRDLRVDTDQFDEEIDHELAVADRLGADLIRVWAGRYDYEEVDDRYFEAVVGDVERIGGRAADYGIEVTVEKHANTVTNSLEGARRLIEAVDRDNVGLNYQPNSTIDAEQLEHEAAELAPLTNHMHALAVHQRGTSDRYPHSSGDYDFEALFRHFVEAGYDGWINVEFVSDDLPYEEAVEADHDYLRSLVD